MITGAVAEINRSFHSLIINKRNHAGTDIRQSMLFYSGVLTVETRLLPSDAEKLLFPVMRNII